MYCYVINLTSKQQTKPVRDILNTVNSSPFYQYENQYFPIRDKTLETADIDAN